MTIRDSLNARNANRRWSYLERCAEVAPKGTYEQAKGLAELIADTINTFRADARDLGLSVPNDDRLREVEALLYVLVADDNLSLCAAEGFGEHADGPAGERVVQQAARDQIALAAPSS